MADVSVAVAREALQKLIDRYGKNSHDESIMGNERQAGQSLIVPLINDVLHWDTVDPSEFKTEMPAGGKRIDYVVCNQGISQFVVEAKAPNKNIFGNPEYYKQTVGYGRSKNRDFAILTNFRQFVILACMIDVRSIAQAEIGRVDLTAATDEDLQLLLNFQKEHWISSGKENPLYSRIGNYDRRILVDEQLLEDMTHWREKLLTNIKKNNKLDFKDEQEFMRIEKEVQKFIDRLIFICFCEDNEFYESPVGHLNSLVSDKMNRFNMDPGYLLGKIRELFSKEEYRKHYDSELFEKSDCDSFAIDDDVILYVLEGLRQRKDGINYNFRSIEEDILGKVYEQFIGHIQTGKKRFKEREDIDKRKKEGIYYTPKYIVDYIVNNTVRECIKGKTFAEINKIRILDPACGSGSFLLRAFDVLVEESEKALKGGRLNYDQKKNLMLNCIYGVDLDERAVEMAKFRLSLKLAERELLPKLGNNIRNGNSLIDVKKIAGDYYAFVWKDEFKEIMDSGGFDVVIGNPPYGIVFKKDEKQYLEEHLPSFRRNNDLYVAFIEKSISLLKEGKLFSFIIPNTYLIGPYFDSLKRLILDRTKIIKILDFGINPIFQDPNVFNSIIILQKEHDQSERDSNTVEFYDMPVLKNSDFINLETISSKTKIVQSQFNNLIWKPKNEIIDRLFTQKDKLLDEVCHVKDVGFNYWSVGRGKKRGDSIGSRVLYEGERKNKKDIPFLKGRDIDRYHYAFGNHWLKYDYETYLNKKIDVFRFSPNFLEVSPKIIYRQTSDRIIATIDYAKHYLDKTVHLIIPRENAEISILALLGILNSTLMLYLYRDMVREEGRVFAQVKTIYIKRIPLKFNERIENKISELVETQLESSKRFHEIGDKKTEEQAKIEREIKKTDGEIDELVYKLYGITDDEKKIIGAARSS